jgi:copper resistance protein C
MTRTTLASWRLIVLATSALVAMTLPADVAAHAELEAASPTDGETVPGPFDGPIVLTFSAALAEGSRADLFNTGGAEFAKAVVDGPGARMTISLETTLPADDYEVRWVSVSDDGDLLRGTVSFTVAPAPPTEAPTPSPTPTPIPTASAEPATPSPAPTASPGSSATPTPAEPTPTGTSDVLIPIIVALVVAVAGAAYLLSRRGRPAD